ncbi:DUF6428 family protein [Cognatishimia activa]|uniref:DUF6428 family protein n=1 Tax=Cognatishimia activa TaxID=1715691 RepID=UPI00222F3E6C|nr:DUF6428 family protein [Cognatishimia activa]UZD90001.1 DUF6428 family protein [Cognatishimia activa]
MRLTDLLEFLETQPADLPVVYQTSEEIIGSGYHLTELKAAPVTSIDCGGNVASFSEVTIQLLDGQDGDYMMVGKLKGILRHSLKEIPALNDAEPRVEFSHFNNGLQLFTLGEPLVSEGAITLPLLTIGAQCKPAVAARGFAPKPGQSIGCGPRTNCC